MSTRSNVPVKPKFNINIEDICETKKVVLNLVSPYIDDSRLMPMFEPFGVEYHHTGNKQDVYTCIIDLQFTLASRFLLPDNYGQWSEEQKREFSLTRLDHSYHIQKTVDISTIPKRIKVTLNEEYDVSRQFDRLPDYESYVVQAYLYSVDKNNCFKEEPDMNKAYISDEFDLAYCLVYKDDNALQKAAEAGEKVGKERAQKERAQEGKAQREAGGKST